MRLGLGNSLIDSSVVGVSAEAQQFLDRLPILPSSSLEGHYATFIDGLVAAGIFDAFDALYLFPVETSSASCVNLVQDRFPLDADNPSNTITFTGLSPTPADAGWESGGTGGRLIAYEDLSTATGLVLARNDASVFAWCVGTAAINSAREVNVIAASGGALLNTISLFSRYTPNYVGGTANALDADQVYDDDNTDGSGFYLVQRTASNAQSIAKDASAVTPVAGATAASVALPAGYLSHFPQRHTRAFGFGRSLTTQERTDLYNLLSAFMTSTAGVVP